MMAALSPLPSLSNRRTEFPAAVVFTPEAAAVQQEGARGVYTADTGGWADHLHAIVVE